MLEIAISNENIVIVKKNIKKNNLLEVVNILNKYIGATIIKKEILYFRIRFIVDKLFYVYYNNKKQFINAIFEN